MKDLVEIVHDYDDKVGNLNVKLLAARDAESAGYAHYMAKVLEASQAQRDENKKLAEIRFKRHGIDPHAQQPSTQAILSRPKEDDEKHWLRPLAAGAQIRDKDGNIDIAERPVTREEVSHIESIRRRPKNSTGQSEKDGASAERKKPAIDAFLCSPGIQLTELERKRVDKIESYTAWPASLPVVKVPPKPVKPGWAPKGLSSYFGQLLDWIKYR